MIKAIIFDYGRVICNFDNGILVKRISKLTGKTEVDIFDLIYKKSDITKRYETGLINSQEFFEELSKICGLKVPYEKLKRVYSEGKFFLIEETSDLIKILMKKYKIAMLSNTSEWDYSYYKRAAPILKKFDVLVKSFEIKAIKPNPKIFEATLNELELKAEECVYTDDIVEYIDVAKSMGFWAIQFRGIDNFQKYLQDVGVEIK